MSNVVKHKSDPYEFQCYLFDLYEKRWRLGVFRKRNMIKICWMKEEKDILFLSYEKIMSEKEYFEMLHYIETKNDLFPYRSAKILEDVYYNYLKFSVKSWAFLYFKIFIETKMRAGTINQYHKFMKEKRKTGLKNERCQALYAAFAPANTHKNG